MEDCRSVTLKKLWNFRKIITNLKSISCNQSKEPSFSKDMKKKNKNKHKRQKLQIKLIQKEKRELLRKDQFHIQDITTIKLQRTAL